MPPLPLHPHFNPPPPRINRYCEGGSQRLISFQASPSANNSGLNTSVPCLQGRLVACLIRAQCPFCCQQSSDSVSQIRGTQTNVPELEPPSLPGFIPGAASNIRQAFTASACQSTPLPTYQISILVSMSKYACTQCLLC